MNRRLKGGFTIVELMIVVAVIGVIASIVVVSYGSSRSKAFDTAVKTDITKYADELNIYYGDNGGYPINQASLLNVSGEFAVSNYKTTGAKAVLYCVDTAAATSGDSMAVIAKSNSGNTYYVSDENPVTQFVGTFPSGNTTTDCRAANAAITTVTAIWVHDNTRADSAGVSQGGWLISVL